MYCILGVPILSRYSQVQFTNNAIMLKYLLHTILIKSDQHAININMALYTVFTMFVNDIGTAKS